MRLPDLLQTLGAPVVHERPVSALVVGHPPGLSAEMLWFDGRLSIYTTPRELYDGRHVDDILHEALHLVAGPRSLDKEDGLMAFQWAVMAELDPDEYVNARKTFGIYNLGRGREVGETDSFLQLKTWATMVAEARRLGLLVGERPVWGLGEHPDWAAFVQRGEDVFPVETGT